jgi:hypothetical protein
VFSTRERDLILLILLVISAINFLYHVGVLDYSAF